MWEGVGDRTETAIFWPPLLWPSTLCLSRSPGLLNQRPTLLGDGFLYCILSASSPDLNLSGPQGPFGLMWLSLPHLIYNSVINWNWSGAPRPLRPDVALPTTSRLSPSRTGTLTSVLTELYNSSTPTQSPTRSLEWHDWLSTSRNNCHAVHRSLSSSASVYECTMGIFLPCPISSANFHPRDFLS